MISITRDDVGKEKEVTILRLDGELNFENTVALREVLHALFKEEKRYKIILDLAKVDFICSYSVGVIVAFSRDLRQEDGDLKFINLQHVPRNTFESTRIDKILDCTFTETETIALFNKTL